MEYSEGGYGRVEETGNASPALEERSDVDSARALLRVLLNDPDAVHEHRHETPELILNFGSGFGSIAWRDAGGNTQVASLGTQSCCFIPGGVVHRVESLRMEGAVSVMVGGGIAAESVRRDLSEVIVEPFRQLTAQDALAGGLLSELGHLTAKQPQTLAFHALGLALALRIVHTILYSKRRYAGAYPPFSPAEQAKALEHIRGHLAERIPVTDLARELCLSRAHFSRRFRVTFGMSPLQYALKMRVDRAIELLRSGDFRVTEAAYAVGFCDQSHFDRHCRKFYGQTPTAMQRLDTGDQEFVADA